MVNKETQVADAAAASWEQVKDHEDAQALPMLQVIDDARTAYDSLKNYSQSLTGWIPPLNVATKRQDNWLATNHYEIAIFDELDLNAIKYSLNAVGVCISETISVLKLFELILIFRYASFQVFHQRRVLNTHLFFFVNSLIVQSHHSRIHALLNPPEYYARVAQLHRINFTLQLYRLDDISLV